MKKLRILLCLALAAVLCLGLAACGETAEEPSGGYKVTFYDSDGVTVLAETPAEGGQAVAGAGRGVAPRGALRPPPAFELGAGRLGGCGPGRDEADWAGPASAGRLVRNEAAGGSPGAPRRASGRVATVILRVSP